MTSPGLPPRARPVAAACVRAMHQRLASGRGQERTLAARLPARGRGADL